jgi:hypothetical protein
MPLQYGLLTYAGGLRLLGPALVGPRPSQRACVVSFRPSPTGRGAEDIYYQGERIGGSLAYGPQGIVPFTHQTGHSLTWVGSLCRVKLWLTDTETFTCWLTSAEQRQFLSALKALAARRRRGGASAAPRR